MAVVDQLPVTGLTGPGTVLRRAGHEAGVAAVAGLAACDVVGERVAGRGRSEHVLAGGVGGGIGGPLPVRRRGGEVPAGRIQWRCCSWVAPGEPVFATSFAGARLAVRGRVSAARSGCVTPRSRGVAAWRAPAGGCRCRRRYRGPGGWLGPEAARRASRPSPSYRRNLNSKAPDEGPPGFPRKRLVPDHSRSDRVVNPTG